MGEKSRHKGGFEVAAGELAARERRAGAAAGEVASLDPARSMSPAAGAIPGAGSAMMLNEVGWQWQQQFSGLSERISSYGEHLATAAASYRQGDDRGAQAFAGPPTGRPVPTA